MRGAWGTVVPGIRGSREGSPSPLLGLGLDLDLAGGEVEVEVEEGETEEVEEEAGEPEGGGVPGPESSVLTLRSCSIRIEVDGGCCCCFHCSIEC